MSPVNRAGPLFRAGPLCFHMRRASPAIISIHSNDFPRYFSGKIKFVFIWQNFIFVDGNSFRRFNFDKFPQFWTFQTVYQWNKAHKFPARLAGLARLCIHMSLASRDLASLKRDPSKPGWSASHMNPILNSYTNNM